MKIKNTFDELELVKSKIKELYVIAEYVISKLQQHNHLLTSMSEKSEDIIRKLMGREKKTLCFGEKAAARVGRWGTTLYLALGTSHGGMLTTKHLRWSKLEIPDPA